MAGHACASVKCLLILSVFSIALKKPADSSTTMSSSQGSHDRDDDYVLVDGSDIPHDYNGKRRSIYSVGRNVQFYMDWVCSIFPGILDFLEEVGSELGFPYSPVTALPKFAQKVYELLKLPPAEARRTVIATFQKLGLAAVVCLVRMEFSVLGAVAFLFTNALMKSALMTSSKFVFLCFDHSSFSFSFCLFRRFLGLIFILLFATV